jgi:hypothetical protein
LLWVKAVEKSFKLRIKDIHRYPLKESIKTLYTEEIRQKPWEFLGNPTLAGQVTPSRASLRFLQNVPDRGQRFTWEDLQDV